MYEYPFGNGQQLNLDWFLAEWKNLLAAWEAEKNGIAGALDAEIAKAEAALADVFAARDAAAQSAANALESKNAAAQSASDASGYLATVRADANAAHDAAQNAAESESNAADSAQTALASKNAAGQSERNAAQSEANANSSKNAAAQSASDADASKSAAAQSAADADASKSAAAQSADDAEDAAASVEASAQQITTNASDIANLKNALYSQYPSRITPFSLAINGSTQGGAIARSFGKITFEPSSGVISNYQFYYVKTLPAGTYKLVLEVLENNVTSEKTTRFGYISVRYGSTYAPIQNLYKDTLMPVRKYEQIFTLPSQQDVRIISSIIDSVGFTGTATIFAYLDIAEPTSALGLALSN